MNSDYGRIALELGKKLAQAPLQVEAQGHIGLDHETLFAYVTTVSKLPEWLPMMKRAESNDTNAETPSGVGSVREIYAIGNKPSACERVVHFESPRLYAYSARDRDLLGTFSKHLGVIAIEPRPDGGSMITWLAYGQPSRFAPLHYMGMRMFAFVLRTGIKNLEKRFPVR